MASYKVRGKTKTGLTFTMREEYTSYEKAREQAMIVAREDPTYFEVEVVDNNYTVKFKVQLSHMLKVTEILPPRGELV